MTKAIILIIVLATVIATYITRSFVAPPIGAAVLFCFLLFGWLYNRGASRASLRETEEATRRQREARAHGEDEGGHSPY